MKRFILSRAGMFTVNLSTLLVGLFSVGTLFNIKEGTPEEVGEIIFKPAEE